jgi:hypothetical protein
MLRRLRVLLRAVRRLKMERRAISVDHLAVVVAVAVVVEAVIDALAVPYVLRLKGLPPLTC